MRRGRSKRAAADRARENIRQGARNKRSRTEGARDASDQKEQKESAFVAGGSGSNAHPSSPPSSPLSSPRSTSSRSSSSSDASSSSDSGAASAPQAQSGARAPSPPRIHDLEPLRPLMHQQDRVIDNRGAVVFAPQFISAAATSNVPGMPADVSAIVSRAELAARKALCAQYQRAIERREAEMMDESAHTSPAEMMGAVHSLAGKLATSSAERDLAILELQRKTDAELRRVFLAQYEKALAAISQLDGAKSRVENSIAKLLEEKTSIGKQRSAFETEKVAAKAKAALLAKSLAEHDAQIARLKAEKVVRDAILAQA